jgi:hypothetical protein
MNIDELLKDIPAYTIEEYRSELAVIYREFKKRNIQPDDIAYLVRNFLIQEDDLVQRWIQTTAMGRYLSDFD